MLVVNKKIGYSILQTKKNEVNEQVFIKFRKYIKKTKRKGREMFAFILLAFWRQKEVSEYLH